MAKIGLIMGSKSDLDIVKETISQLKYFGIEHEVIISSAHRTPDETALWVKSAKISGIDIIICFAGAAAHLAGVVASKCNLPIIAVPISATSLNGLDALLATVQMPGGIPVASMAIGKAGAKNAAIFAAQILAIQDQTLYTKLEQFRDDMKNKIAKENLTLQDELKTL